MAATLLPLAITLALVTMLASATMAIVALVSNVTSLIHAWKVHMVAMSTAASAIFSNLALHPAPVRRDGLAMGVCACLSTGADQASQRTFQT